MPTGGIPFSVNVTVTGQVDLLMTYQIAIKYDRTAINCTAAWINKDDPSFILYPNRDIPVIVPDAVIDSTIGYVYLGASFAEADSYVNATSGLMAQANFTALRRSNYTIELIPVGDLEYPDQTFLLNTNQNDIAFSRESFSLNVQCGPSTPVAQFSFAPSNPMPNNNITFDSSKSYDPYGNITEYMWDFGDGSAENATAGTLLHAFASLGVYMVNLTVLNDFAFNPAYNYSNYVVREVQVGVPPEANFTYQPSDPKEDELITFDASQSPATNASIVSYAWDFGDGTGNTTNLTPVTHTYVNRGVYYVNLTVFDSHGLHGSIRTLIQVGGIPTAIFTFTPHNPKVNEVVTFNATQSKASNQGDTIISYMWDFGDGYTSELDSSDPNATIPQHSYTDASTYNVTLTVYDNDGLFNSAWQEIVVTSEVPPDYTIYIIVAVVIAIVVIIGSVVLLRRRPKRHTPKPAKK